MTDRFLRHFTQVAVCPFDDASLQAIYSSLLKWHFETKNFPPGMNSICTHLSGCPISATLDHGSDLRSLL